MDRTTWRWVFVTAVTLVTAACAGAQLIRQDSYFSMELRLFLAGLHRWCGDAEDPVILPQGIRLAPMAVAAPAVFGALPAWTLDRRNLSGQAAGPPPWLTMDTLVDTAGPGPVLAALRLGRIVVLSLWIASIWLLWLVLRRYGHAAATTAIVFYAFSPSFLSFGHLLSSDTLACVAAIAACAAMSWYVVRPGPARAGVAGAAIAAGISTKLSLIVLVPSWVFATYAAGATLYQGSAARVLGRLLWHTVVALVVAWAVLGAIHGFSYGYPPPYERPMSATVARYLSGQSALGMWGPTIARIIPAELLRAVDAQCRSHETYIAPVRVLGQWFTTGTPLYYIGTAVAKEPVGFVVVLAAALLVAVCIVCWPFSQEARYVVPFAAFSLLLLVVASTMPGYQDYRYVLPALAVLPACTAYCLSTAPRPVCTVLYLATWLGAIEGLGAWPHYTAFVNVVGHYAAGDGHRLVDPKTVYRTQDLFRLREWLSRHPQVEIVALDIDTGEAPLALYGLPKPPAAARLAHSQGTVSSNSTHRFVQPGWYVMHKSLVADDPLAVVTTDGGWPGSRSVYDYLRGKRPDITVGTTIYAYQLTRDDCRRITQTVPAALSYPRQQ